MSKPYQLRKLSQTQAYGSGPAGRKLGLALHHLKSMALGGARLKFS